MQKLGRVPFSNFGQQKRLMRFEPLKNYDVKPEQYKIIYFIFAVSAVIIGYDIYYVLYLHEPPIYELSTKEFRKAFLKEIVPVTNSTSLFRFHILTSSVENTPIPSHVLVKDDTCQVARAYTPIAFTRETIDLLVKKYDDGLVSKHIHNLKVGDKMEMLGPIWSFPYETNMADEIGMIAGGTGINPMYQLIKQILRDPLDNTKISLIYANRNEGEIVLKNELEILSRNRPDRLRVYYVLDEAPKNWEYGKGIISKKILKENLPTGARSLVLVCGPEPMVKYLAGRKVAANNQGAIDGLLKELEYTEQNVFKF